MIRKYRNYGFAAVGVGVLSVVGMLIFGRPTIGFPDAVGLSLALVLMVASLSAVVFFTRAKGYAWGLGFVLALGSVVGGIGVLALIVLLMLPDRPRPPEQPT